MKKMLAMKNVIIAVLVTLMYMDACLSASSMDLGIAVGAVGMMIITFVGMCDIDSRIYESEKRKRKKRNKERSKEKWSMRLVS